MSGAYRVKHLASLNARSLRDDEPDDLEFRYVDISTVGRGELVAEPQRIRFDDAPSRARRLVRSGDTIISTVRTYLRAVWPVAGPADDLVVSTGFTVVSPGPRLDSRFFGWWAQSDACIEEIVARSVGVSYPAVNASDIGDLRVELPTRNEQREIADFLDAETARIDAVIEKKRQMHVLLGERRRVVIDRLLDVGGETRLRHVTSRLTSGPRGWAGYTSDDGALFLRITNVRRNSIELDLSDSVYVTPPSGTEALRTRVRSGDVLLSITADIGSVGLAREDHEGAHVSQHIALMTPSTCSGEWLAYALSTSSARQQLDAARYGGTKTQLALEDVADVVVSIPSESAQNRSLEKVCSVVASIHATEDRLDRQVDLLREHRQALVTAAVTGKLDLAKAAA